MRTRLCIQPMCPKLLHAGIDDRDPGSPPPPCLQPHRIVTPRHRGEFLTAAGHRADPDDAKAGMVREFRLQQLADEFRRVCRPPRVPATAFSTWHGGDLAEPQMGRQHRGAIRTGLVPAGGITRYRRGQKTIEPVPRASLPRCPIVAQSARPIGTLRQQFPVVQPVGRGRWRRRHGRWRRQRIVRVQRLTRTGERREHAKRSARFLVFTLVGPKQGRRCACDGTARRAPRDGPRSRDRRRGNPDRPCRRCIPPPRR